MQYTSDELDALAGATNYYRWILGHWRPYIGGTVLELGAGIGTFSSWLLQERLDRLVLVEPSDGLEAQLREKFHDRPTVEVIHGELEDAVDRFRGSIDCIASVNVLEHIADDRAALRTARALLVPGGSILLFVPALPILWGPMDANFGHHRRYTKAGLTRLLTDCGFSVKRARYMNLLGTFSWFVANQILRRRTITARMVEASDRSLIPLSAWLERKVAPPFGQSVMVVAQSL